MKPSRFKKITTQLPDDCFCAVRDISLLSASVFGECHAVTIKKAFGVNMFTFWHVLDQQVHFYRSHKENTQFSKMVALRYWKDEKYSLELSNRLIEETDWLNAFVKERTYADFQKDAPSFFSHYLKFFVLHQAVNWGGEYLSDTKTASRDRLKIQRIVRSLRTAYKYNELVIPNVERYFRKLEVTNLLYKEILAGKSATLRKRSILFIGGHRFTLSSSQATKLEEMLRGTHKDLGDVQEIRGLPVGGGTYIGRAKLVKNFENLKRVAAGDVLVTFMTRPQFNSQIMHASAIITNEGGILCHAALLAREFHIPCVVGTRTATTIIKDGSLVEVNADTGVVKVLSQRKGKDDRADGGMGSATIHHAMICRCPGHVEQTLGVKCITC